MNKMTLKKIEGKNWEVKAEKSFATIEVMLEQIPLQMNVKSSMTPPYVALVRHGGNLFDVDELAKLGFEIDFDGLVEEAVKLIADAKEALQEVARKVSREKLEKSRLKALIPEFEKSGFVVTYDMERMVKNLADMFSMRVTRNETTVRVYEGNARWDRAGKWFCIDSGIYKFEKKTSKADKVVRLTEEVIAEKVRREALEEKMKKAKIEEEEKDAKGLENAKKTLFEITKGRDDLKVYRAGYEHTLRLRKMTGPSEYQYEEILQGIKASHDDTKYYAMHLPVMTKEQFIQLVKIFI